MSSGTTLLTSAATARAIAYRGVGMQVGTRHVLEDFCVLIRQGPGNLRNEREKLVVNEMLGIFQDLDKGQRGIDQLSERTLYHPDELRCMKFAEHIAKTLGETLDERPNTKRYVANCTRVLMEYQRLLAGYDTPRFSWQPGEQEKALEITRHFVTLMQGVGWSFYPEN